MRYNLKSRVKENTRKVGRSEMGRRHGKEGGERKGEKKEVNLNCQNI